MKMKQYMSDHSITQSDIAKRLNVPRESVSRWIAEDKVPLKHCIELEKMFLGVVQCEDLNNSITWSYLRKTKRRIEQGESNG